MYYITIQVNEGGAKKLYEAKVCEKSWENFKQLIEFKPVEDGATHVPGGIEDVPMGHENDIHFVDLARFAVSEYNKKAVSPQPPLFSHVHLCEVRLNCCLDR
jgi:hypothetical protein